jgi:hypothetical protein
MEEFVFLSVVAFFRSFFVIIIVSIGVVVVFVTGVGWGGRAGGEGAERGAVLDGAGVEEGGEADGLVDGVWVRLSILVWGGVGISIRAVWAVIIAGGWV